MTRCTPVVCWAKHARVRRLAGEDADIDPHGALRLTDARHPLLSVLPQGASV